ncbi:MAG: TonB-dependent receptor, partial [Pedobacter sp.]
MKKIFTKFSVLTFFCLLLLDVASAQNVTITGTVKDDSNGPIPYASIMIKGTNRAVQTETNGNYSISAPSNATLIFSYLGFISQEIAVAGKSKIDVILRTDTKNLEQVVVVGYGTQKKQDVTGSISSVRGEDIARMPAVQPMASLQGKVPGLTIVNSGGAGSRPVVRIRGIASTNNAEPLYVVDGLIQDNIDFLNPADIESIDLLRDASSSAIYGLRGSNGVIAITTKRAAKGQTSINFTSNVGVQKVLNTIDVVDAAGFKKLYSAQLANINAAPFDYSNYTGDTDWQNLIIQDAVINSNSLSFSNSGEKTTTLVSLGFNNQDGVLKYENYKKYVVRLNEEIRVSDKFKIGATVTGFHALSNPTSAGLNNALWAAPIVPVQTDEFSYYAMPSFQRAQVGNVVAALNRGNNTSINKAFRFNGSFFAELKFLKDFTLRSTLYADYGMSYGRSYNRPPFNVINLGENGVPTTTTVDPLFRSTVGQYQNETHRYQQDHTLTYEKSFESGHRFTAMAGLTSLRFAGSNLSGSRTDSTLVVPGDPDLWYLSIVNAQNVMSNSGGGGEETNAGAFGRVSYAYQNKYLFNGTIRRDGTSRVAPANRWGTFGSVGLGWVASEENFFKNNLKGIDYMKIRASWGRLGNSNGVPGNLFQQGLSNGSQAIFGDYIYTAITNAYRPDSSLRYEVVQGVDIGLEFRTLNNRLGVDVNVYNKTTNGNITTFPLPASQGGLTYYTNLGDLTNKGIEASLSWSDKIGESFSYGLSGNFSYNKNRVTSLGNTTEFQITGNGGVNLTNTGQSIGYFYGYRQIGIYQTAKEMLTQPGFTNSLPGDIRFEDINGDGVISPLDRTNLGSPFPPYSYGMSLTLGFKGFDALVEGQGVAGNKIYTQRRTANFATLNYESNRLNAWTAPGSTNVEPILDNTRGNNFLFSSYFLEPGDYFRLRTVQVGYTFGKTIMNKVGIQKMRVYLSGQNIKTWTQATGYTPEAQIGSITGGGADNG